MKTFLRPSSPACYNCLGRTSLGRTSLGRNTLGLEEA